MSWDTLAGLMVALFTGLFLLEQLRPLRPRTRTLLTRLVVNLSLSVLAFLIGAYVVTPAALSVAGWASGRPFGLVHLLPLPAWLQAVLGFLLMDVSFYYWHLANHKIPLLWRFHNVHHTDPDLDVSTALRFHFGEVFFSTLFRILQVGMIGVGPWTYFAYELAFQGNTLFHHSNVALPLRLERLLNLLLVTPRMHGIHHSVVEQETNSNFSVVLSWWDRLHRSLRLDIPQSAIVVGVPAYRDPADNRLALLLVLPFRPQRDYWCYPDGTRPRRDSAEGMPRKMQP